MASALYLALVLLGADPSFKPDQSKLPVPPPKGARGLLDEAGKHSFLSMAGAKIDWPVGYWRSDHYGALSKGVLSRPAIVMDP